MREVSNSPSPPKSKVGKTKYLYEKLAGVENNPREQTNYIYDKRIKSFTDLLFKLQYAHNIYINLDLKNEELNNRSRRVKYYVGPGNNSSMIKGLLKRRYWWVMSEDRNQCSFVWTQIKINAIFDKQKRASKVECHYRTQKYEEEEAQEKQKKHRGTKSEMTQKINKGTS